MFIIYLFCLLICTGYLLCTVANSYMYRLRQKTTSSVLKPLSRRLKKLEEKERSRRRREAEMDTRMQLVEELIQMLYHTYSQANKSLQPNGMQQQLDRLLGLVQHNRQRSNSSGKRDEGEVGVAVGVDAGPTSRVEDPGGSRVGDRSCKRRCFSTRRGAAFLDDEATERALRVGEPSGQR